MKAEEFAKFCKQIDRENAAKRDANPDLIFASPESQTDVWNWIYLELDTEKNTARLSFDYDISYFSADLLNSILQTERGKISPIISACRMSWIATDASARFNVISSPEFRNSNIGKIPREVLRFLCDKAGLTHSQACAKTFFGLLLSARAAIVKPTPQPEPEEMHEKLTLPRAPGADNLKWFFNKYPIVKEREITEFLVKQTLEKHPGQHPEVLCLIVEACNDARVKLPLAVIAHRLNSGKYDPETLVFIRAELNPRNGEFCACGATLREYSTIATSRSGLICDTCKMNYRDY